MKTISEIFKSKPELLEEKEVKERKKTREKFTCPTCHQSAWAKKTAKLACGNSVQPMIIEEE